MSAIRADENCAPRGKGRNLHHPRLLFGKRDFHGFTSRDQAEWYALAADTPCEVRTYTDDTGKAHYFLVRIAKPRTHKPDPRQVSGLASRYAEMRAAKESLQASSTIGMQEKAKSESLRHRAVALGLTK